VDLHLAPVLLGLLVALSACSGGASASQDACAVPYVSQSSAQVCTGGYVQASSLGSDAEHGETWEIVVASRDPSQIAGALSSFWREHAGRATTVLARSAREATRLGYDRGILFDRDGELTYGVCTAWSDLGAPIGEICNDQVRFSLARPPLVATGPSAAAATEARTEAATPSAPPITAAPDEAILVGAGDIASCTSRGDEATAAILRQVEGTVFTAGDNAYDAGSIGQFESCYGPSWGPFRARTRPAIGNHEYATPGAAGYFEYFGAAAGAEPGAYYAFDLNGWRIYVLNSNCIEIDGCQAGSPQERWLQADLQRHRVACSVAIWHHPRFSSGLQGNELDMQPIWQDLYAAGAELVISGHDHIYERFAPLDADGRPDAARGIREFVVGTGGASHELLREPVPGSEVRNRDTFGVLALALGEHGYRWQFLPEAGKTFTDAGSGTCH
jgi:hypothetical protein